MDHIDDDDLQTIIYILKPKCSLEECATEGFWYEKTKGYEPEIWKFSGTLERTEPHRAVGKLSTALAPSSAPSLQPGGDPPMSTNWTRSNG